MDSVHPDEWDRWLAVLPPPSPDEDYAITAARRDFTMSAEGWEGFDWAASSSQMRAVTTLDSTPLVVLTASQDPSLWGNIPLEIAEQLCQTWLEMQEELASLSSSSAHIIASTANHIVHYEEPDLIVDAILDLVAAASNE